jgi:hypothetical protein
MHLIRFAGVLSAHAALRAQVVKGISETPLTTLPLCQLPLPLPAAAPSPIRKRPRRPARTPWAKLLARVFAVDVTVCPACRGPMKILSFAITPDQIKRWLPPCPRPPPFSPALPSIPQPALDFS